MVRSMNTLDYETIAQGEVDLLSPVSSERLDRVIDLLELPDDARVIDLCCGKGEVLVRTLARYGCTGDGLDASPAFLAAARPAGKEQEVQHPSRHPVDSAIAVS